MHADFSVHCCWNLLSQFPGILSHSAGNNCSTVVTVACALTQVRYSFWTAKKNWHKSRPKRKRIHARMIESSMYRYIFDIDRGKGKNSAASSIMDTLVIIAPCSSHQHSMWFPILHCDKRASFLNGHYEERPLNLQTSPIRSLMNFLTMRYNPLCR